MSRFGTLEVRFGAEKLRLDEFEADFVEPSGGEVLVDGTDLLKLNDEEMRQRRHDIADQAVTGADVAGDTLQANDLAPDSVGSEELGDGIHNRYDTVTVAGGTDGHAQSTSAR